MHPAFVAAALTVHKCTVSYFQHDLRKLQRIGELVDGDGEMLLHSPVALLHVALVHPRPNICIININLT